MSDDLENQFRAALNNGALGPIEEIRAQLDGLQPQPRARPLMLQSALWYARHGLKVFPVMPNEKRPWPRSHGFEDATTDEEKIAWWFGKDKAPSNLAIATGHGIDVIDIDGPAGHQALADKIREEHGDGAEGWRWELLGIDVVAIVSTPRAGGLHIWRPATGAGNRAGLYQSVDYRGLGGYVVVPPSFTGEGTYAFVRPPSPDRLKQLHQSIQE